MNYFIQAEYLVTRSIDKQINLQAKLTKFTQKKVTM